MEKELKPLSKKQFLKILKKNIKIHEKFNKIRLKQIEREDIFGGK